MEKLILDHLETVRGITENSIKKITRKISEEKVNIIPNGFNNNIRWNFGHIAYVQEKLVFMLAGEEMKIPSHYEQLFGAGTKPADWQETPPSLDDIADVLANQKERVKAFIPGHFHDKLITPFTNKAGITFDTVGATFLFSLYHEAVHMENIRHLYKTITVNYA
ncbi:DinB family protein [Priestia megaterium]|nr:DinB family protein [Priestia megaterium]